MKFADLTDRLNSVVGRTCAWLTLIMVIVTLIIVILRYVFDIGWIWLQESVSWMHAAIFMLAAAHTLARDEHVRVDIFYRKLTPVGRAMVDAVGTVFFLIPVCVFLIWGSWDYVRVAWEIREGSPEAGGLGFPWVPLLKGFIPIMSGLLLLQGIAMLCRAAITIRSSR
jgi:TRAP-type mannitol/chloroaromatic compound transport system permease small subunit